MRVVAVTITGSLMVAAASLYCGSAPAQERTAPPSLRIEAGMHAAPLRFAALDPKDRFVITVGDDATARIWSLPDIELLLVFRPPLSRPDPSQSLEAIACSPDGSLGAVSGRLYDTDGVYVFEPLTGHLTKRLALRDGNAYALAFSPDGEWLAAGVSDFGVRIWSTRDWSIKTEDPSYKGTIQGIDFSPSGSLAVTDTDGHIHLYDPHFAEIAKMTAFAGRIPFSVKFSPDGGRVAVGFGDVPAVEVRSATDLSLIATPDRSGLRSGDLDAIAWSADGNDLLAGGESVLPGGAGASVLAWADKGAGSRRNYLPRPLFRWIAAILPRPDGSIILAGRDPGLAVADEHEVRASKARPFLAFENARPAPGAPSCRLGISADGRTLEAPLAGQDGRVLRVNTAPFGISLAGSPGPNTRVAETMDRGSGMLVGATPWYGQPSITVAEKNVALGEFDYIYALDVHSQRIAIGTRWQLRLVGYHGAVIWRQPVPATVRCVVQTEDGRLLSAVLDDGTLRWYRGSDGKPLLTMFVHADLSRWVAFTASGYYTAERGGEELIGWQVQNGRDRAADFVGSAELRDKFRRPDIVSKVLETLSEEEAVGLGAATPAASAPSSPH